ncbi:MAG: SDR family oxidoreductase [Candidatus Nanopelagicales bacterium]
MRVLLTGHQGYLGTVMRQTLSDAGHDVVGLDTGFFADCLLGPAVDDGPTIVCDLREVAAEHVRGFDAVIHLAALSNDPLGNLAPQITYSINHHASVRLAQVAKAAGVKRFLYSSTCSVYGSAGGDALVGEDAPLDPITPYAISKVRVEADLHALADDDFSPVSLRNATAFGFSPRLRADIVLNNLVGLALLTGEVRVLSDGTPWRPLVHAQDVASAFLAALEADRAVIHDQAFNVGSDSQNLRVSQIADLVADAVPGSRVNITGEAGNDPRSYRVDFAKITDALPAYAPSWTTAAGAAELYDSYRRWGLDQRSFDHVFTRLPHLRDLERQGRIDHELRWV